MRPARARAVAVASCAWLQVKDPSSGYLALAGTEEQLDPGEVAAIALAHELRADVVLMDEKFVSHANRQGEPVCAKGASPDGGDGDGGGGAGRGGALGARGGGRAGEGGARGGRLHRLREPGFSRVTLALHTLGSRPC